MIWRNARTVGGASDRQRRLEMEAIPLAEADGGRDCYARLIGLVAQLDFIEQAREDDLADEKDCDDARDVGSGQPEPDAAGEQRQQALG